MSGFELPLWATIPATFLLITGGLLALIGGIGLLRMPNFYQRMHPPTMGTTLGTGCVLIASMIASAAFADRPVVHELLITVFVVITTPVTAMLLARTPAHRRRMKAQRQQEGGKPGERSQGGQ